MPVYGAIAGGAAKAWRSMLVSGLYWLPRYTNTDATSYGLWAGSDPHQPTGVARCPKCFSATLQRPQSSVCTICYGTTWTGGFAPGRSLLGLIAAGSYTLRLQETGQLMAVAGTWLHCDPNDGPILPQDLLVAQGFPQVRYLAGEEAQAPTIGDTTFARIVQLETLAPDSPWQLVPVP